MCGLRISGKARDVFAELQRIAEQNKSKSVYDCIIEKRKDRLDRATAEQFCVSLEVYRGWLGNGLQNKTK